MPARSRQQGQLGVSFSGSYLYDRKTEITTLVSVASDGTAGANGARFRTEHRLYELRAARVPEAEPVFGLFRCEPLCTEVARLKGGYGTTGESIVASVPLEEPVLSHGRINALELFTAGGSYVTGGLQTLDRVSFR